MSSLPFISHRLFVAAVEHEQRHGPQSGRPQNVRESHARELVSAEMAIEDVPFHVADDSLSSSPLVRET